MKLKVCIIVLWSFASVMFIGCNSSGKTVTAALTKDSCTVIVSAGNKTRPDGSQPVQLNTVLEYTVVFESYKQLDQKKIQDVMFGMEDKFELVVDGLSALPVFCQPVASGTKNRFIYLLSFELDTLRQKAFKKIIIHPNTLIKDSIHYNLM